MGDRDALRRRKAFFASFLLPLDKKEGVWRDATRRFKLWECKNLGSVPNGAPMKVGRVESLNRDLQPESFIT